MCAFLTNDLRVGLGYFWFVDIPFDTGKCKSGELIGIGLMWTRNLDFMVTETIVKQHMQKESISDINLYLFWHPLGGS